MSQEGSLVDKIYMFAVLCILQVGRGSMYDFYSFCIGDGNLLEVGDITGTRISLWVIFDQEGNIMVVTNRIYYRP